jgi:hypothetical protein
VTVEVDQCASRPQLPKLFAAAVEHFKDEGWWLRSVIYGAERQAQVLAGGLDPLELSLPRGKALLGPPPRSRELLENSTGDIAALHKQSACT